VLPVAVFSSFVFWPELHKMSSQTFANLMQGLVGVGTLLLALSAFMALNSWQQQRSYELGTSLIAALSEVLARIRFYRLFAHLNREERPAVRDQIYEAGKDLEKLFHLAIAYWGDDIKQHKKQLANIIDEFSLRSNTYENFVDGRLPSSYPSHAIEEATKVAVLDFTEDEGKNDYSIRINAVASKLEGFVRHRMN
jgi:hypothetical protein